MEVTYELFNIDLIGPGANINGAPLDVVAMDLKPVPVIFEEERVGTARPLLVKDEYIVCNITLDSDIIDKIKETYIHIAFNINDNDSLDIIGLSLQGVPQKPDQDTLGYIVRQNILTFEKVEQWRKKGWSKKRIAKQLEKLADANGRRKD